MVIMNNANTTERLIHEVRSRPPLWDQRNLNYHNRVVVNALWQDIADLLQVNKETVKVKWKGLRDTYRRELKKQRSTVNNIQNGVSGENARDPSWTHYSSMNFLREYMGSNHNQNDLFHFQGWPTDDMVADEEAGSPNATNEAFRPFAAAAEEQNNSTTVKPSSSTSPVPSLSGDDLTRDVKTELPSPDRRETMAESSSSSPPLPPPPISENRVEATNQPKKRPIARFSRLRDHRLRSRLQKGKQQQLHLHQTNRSSFPHQNGYDVSPAEDSDDDLYFFKSLIPYVKNLPPTRKLYLRSEIHNLVLREIMADTTNNSSSSHHHTVIPLEHVTVGLNA